MNNKDNRGGSRENSGRKGIGNNKPNVTLSDMHLEHLNQMFPGESVPEQLRRCLEYCYENFDFGLINVLKVPSDKDPDVNLCFVLSSYEDWEPPVKMEWKEKMLFNRTTFRCNKISFNALTGYFNIEIKCKDIITGENVELVKDEKIHEIALEILKKSRSIADIQKIAFGDYASLDGGILDKYLLYNPKYVNEVKSLIDEKSISLSKIQNLLWENNLEKYNSSEEYFELFTDLIARNKIKLFDLISLILKDDSGEPQQQNTNKSVSIKKVLNQISPIDRHIIDRVIRGSSKELSSSINKVIQLNGLENLQIDSEHHDSVTQNLIKFSEENLDIFLHVILRGIFDFYQKNLVEKNYALFKPIDEEVKKKYANLAKEIIVILKKINTINKELSRYPEKTISLKIKPVKYTTI